MFNDWKLHWIECCLERKQKFIERGYKSDLLDKHISAVEKLDRKWNVKGKR